VINQELVGDLMTIVYHFAGKLYGTRPHKYKECAKDISTQA